MPGPHNHHHHPQLHALHTSPWPPSQQPSDKPLPTLPSLPSPTLTNPDHILPSGLPTVSSPPRVTRGPPSPSYLRDSGGESPSPKAAMGRKEKLGLMSRKMMLLRSRTASGGAPNGGSITRGSPSQGSIDADFIPSSPILQDVGNLAPEQPDYLQPPDMDRRSNSGGSSSSDISGMTNFLAKYGKPDGASDDETENGESSAPARYENSAEEHDAEADRRRQEEYNSAVLSKRAEQILANAKIRLNVMEGNLRGARDLVAPLTAANLKRATSLGSASFSPAYSHGRRYASNGYDYNGEDQQSARRLQTQNSSPTMGRDYQGHSRGFSETEIPERPYTSLDQPHYMMSRSIRTPGRGVDPSAGPGLRGSRSHDSLGSSGVGYGVAMHARDSPESNHLEPLPEADENRRSFRDSRNGVDHGVNNGLGIYRPSSRTSDLREQMSTLKGKISTLKERAREDSLRRQSQLSLRNSSPFNNAVGTAPELFYTSSSSYGSPVLDANARVGWASNSNSPASPQKMWENGVPVTGSRNAFAEQAAAQKQTGLQQARIVEIVAPKTPDSKFQVRKAKNVEPMPPITHRRTPSGTAIIDSAKNRYSHHQHKNSQEMPGTFVDEDSYLDVPSPGLSTDLSDSSPISSQSSHVDDDYAPSEDEASVYEDAQHDQNDQKPVVAHEDREDAFDYEHCFLHSAMGTYSNGRRGSESSGASVSSVSTARGPALVGDEDEDAFRQESELFPPPTPETPEKLREIERNLHKRTMSDESISTLDTYATADEDHDEGPVLPMEEPSRRISTFSRRDVSPLESDLANNPRSAPQPPPSQPNSRPSTAVKHHPRRDSGSERADSGVGGISHRPTPSTDSQRAPPGSLTPKQSRSLGTALSTPPTSPRALARQDPATVAVNALLDPSGKALGLRNKAVLFSVVEGLRKVVHQLQSEEDADPRSRVLRKRLEDVRAVLDGKGVVGL
ncbi:hypothetical protein M409DRAFT_62804 [Zasmidium cellare ATCC 36951]|uniref:Uncharacterized protein n=1 Tax=Zasmidium cellare ATCC 36951 TaxID=1080233 RepID=A0A6A6D494_ZASCE|nr:uncharacterized protein M409DRAFT_62804 [Zasmidium cellare ATCC 36951]KAF2173238.1 hypothetical protein M409DRAFT_62804 [Zasmidium cellare ATCC 36951]